MSFVISYETLFDVLRKESNREDLQSLPDTFYEDVASFIAEKKLDSSSRGRIEYENSKKIVRELYERRERKILLLALNKARTNSGIIDSSVLLEREKSFFETIVSELEHHKKEMLLVIEQGVPKTEAEKAEEEEAQVVEDKETQNAASEKKVAEPEIATPAEEKPKDKRNEPQLEDDEKKVKFLVSVPKFVGKDMTIFGPFNPGDTTNLPEDVATILEKKGRVEFV